MNMKAVFVTILVAAITGVTVGLTVSAALNHGQTVLVSQYDELKAKYDALAKTESYYATLANFLTDHADASYSAGFNLTQVLATPRVGIVSAMPMEQAPILAAMNVSGEVNISGYEFFVGTMGNQQVVSVRSGEKEYAVTQATTLMDVFFNIHAAILSGTAGARDPNITVGDVVLGGFVVDKSSIHYYLGNATYQYYEDGYGGVEIVNLTSVPNAVYAGFGSAQVVPSNASTYGYGYGADHAYTYFEALPASLGLLRLAENYTLPHTPLSYITGQNASGYAESYVVAGVVGSANQWTEPLSWMSQQNALYETDAGENEGMGFAYVNTHFNIPWLIVRGISDSPWYPDTYQGVWAADAAANVTVFVAEHFSPGLPYLNKTVAFQDLSPMSNAWAHGYIVAVQVYYVGLNPVLIVYIAQSGDHIYYVPSTTWNHEYSYNYTPPNL
jgi:adenosylhomocysteine nucleosidase